MKVIGYVVEAPNGRLYGMWDTAEKAVEWMNDTGRNLAGSLNIRVVYDGPNVLGPNHVAGKE